MIELTPFPINSIASYHHISYQVQAMYEAVRKGWPLRGTNLPEASAVRSCILKENISKGYFLHTEKVADLI